MSAYIVNPEVIARLANEIAKKAAPKIAKALIAENVRSIEHRYPDTAGHAIEFFTGLSDAEYLKTVQDLLNAPQKLAEFAPNDRGDSSEYDYQCCEHPEYDSSEVKAWISAL